MSGPHEDRLRRSLLATMAEESGSAGWDESIVDRWLAYTDESHRPMTPETRTAFTEHVLRPGDHLASTEFLVDRLARALERHANDTTRKGSGMNTTIDPVDTAAASRAAIARIPLADRDLLADAVQQTLSHGIGTEAKREDYLRLLGALRKRSVRDRLVIGLTGDGMDRDDAQSLVAAYADTVEKVGDLLDPEAFATLIDTLTDDGAEFDDAVRMARALAKRLNIDAANAGGEMDRAPTRDELVEALVSDGLVLAIATYAADLCVRHLGRTDGRLDQSEVHDLTEVMLDESMDPYRVREIIAHLTYRLRLNRDMRGPWSHGASNDGSEDR